jgi:Uncharacterized conserved protein
MGRDNGGALIDDAADVPPSPVATQDTKDGQFHKSVSVDSVHPSNSPDYPGDAPVATQGRDEELARCDECGAALAGQLITQLADYEAVLADKRRLTRELDIALCGEDGAAKQASLCDLIPIAKALRSEVENMYRANGNLLGENNTLRREVERLKAERDDWKRKNAINLRAAVEYGNKLQQECQPQLAASETEVERLTAELDDYRGAIHVMEQNDTLRTQLAAAREALEKIERNVTGDVRVAVEIARAALDTGKGEG